MTEASISIEGMSCQHCVMRVKKAIEKLSGILKLEVNIGNVKVQFDESKVDKADIIGAIEKAGYKVKTV
jgi:copper ion binding protein